MRYSKCEKSALVSFVVEDQEKQLKTLTAFQDKPIGIMSPEKLLQKEAIEETLLLSTDIDIKYNKCTLVVTRFVIK